MLKLGHIVYSNCFPPHAGIVTQRVAFPFQLVAGIPTELNRMLFDGRVDVSPSSSIEYAMNPDRYLLLPHLSITSRKKVMSIILQSLVPLEHLYKKTVALTTASATSVVLLRILLELQHDVYPTYVLYNQGVDDPSMQADAFLTIGDLAITQPAVPGYSYRYDLGELWYEFTQLPFVFAVWHVNYKKNIEQELASLYDILILSKAYGLKHREELARDHEGRFGIPAHVLLHYWSSFSYEFEEEEQKGLMAFYGYAAEIKAVNAVKDLRFWVKQ
jgi:chorismate dehydratase